MNDPWQVRKIGQTVSVSYEQLGMQHLAANRPPRPPVPRWRRWRATVQMWWWYHRPHIHFGPCDGGDW